MLYIIIPWFGAQRFDRIIAEYIREFISLCRAALVIGSVHWWSVCILRLSVCCIGLGYCLLSGCRRCVFLLHSFFLRVSSSHFVIKSFLVFRLYFLKMELRKKVKVTIDRSWGWSGKQQKVADALKENFGLTDDQII